MNCYTVEIERTYRTTISIKASSRKQAMRDVQGIAERGHEHGDLAQINVRILDVADGRSDCSQSM